MKGMSGDSGDRLIQGMHQEKEFQDASLMVAENLNNPNKSRAKGPSGRKLPTRKKTEENEQQQSKSLNFSNPFEAGFKKKLSKCLIQNKKPLEPEPEVDLNLVGKLNQAEFNRVWFFKVPSNPSLSVETLNVSERRIDEVVDVDESTNNNLVKKIEIEEESEKDDNNSSVESEKLKSRRKIFKNCIIL